MTTIEIECPVEGTWSFLNPPGHHPAAKDFVAVDEKGKPYTFFDFAKHLFWQLKVSNVFSWGKKVFAPFDGVIIQAENFCDDRESLNLIRDVIVGLLTAPRQKKNGPKFFLGNHIIMHLDNGFYALFAHLKKGSIEVKKGERIQRGQHIASVGNSGNTIQPHLHFQLMRSNNLFSDTPIPFVFSSYEIKEGRTWKEERDGLPANRRVFRRSSTEKCITHRQTV